MLTHLTSIWRPNWGWPRSNFAEIFGNGKLESSLALFCDPKFSRFHTVPGVTDIQTHDDGIMIGLYRASIASRSKNVPFSDSDER